MRVVIEVKNLSFKIGNKQILNTIDLTVNKGELFGILGPNGSGKTTLLNNIAGMVTIQTGEVFIDGIALQQYKTKELAKQMAVLPQLSDAPFSFTVYDAIKLGRYSHQSSLFPSWSKLDEEKVNEAITLTNIQHLKERYIDELSGGERQLVYLARALAQEAKILLLDEPTNHLDVSHQMDLLELLKRLVVEQKLTIMTIFHDLNLASLYCDRIFLLKEGREVCTDKARNVFKHEQLSEIYDTSLETIDHPVVPKSLITFIPSYLIESIKDDVRPYINEHTKDWLVLLTTNPYKTLSSAIIGSGFSWSTTFATLHVDKNYLCDDPVEDIKSNLIKRGYDHTRTIGMMTAATLEDASFKEYMGEQFSLKVMVTAGVSNAVDISQASIYHSDDIKHGTINTWIFIEGIMSEAAFAQSIMTATEAKTKAMHVEEIVDHASNTLATGTSTDSIMIAASQEGTQFEYAGTITKVGRAIGTCVFEATVESLQKYKRRIRDSR